MTLAELTLPMPYDQCKYLALVYDYGTAAEWYLIQQQHGDPRHVAGGQQLTDGRWMMGGHVLSELHPGGILAWAIPHLTPEFKEKVGVMPLADALALLAPESPSPVI